MKRRKGSAARSCVLGVVLIAVALLAISCGGGASTGSGGTRTDPPGVIHLISLAARYLVYDPGRQVIYASVYSADPRYPNTITIISPASKQIVGTIAVGRDPAAMALSDNGQYLYVVLESNGNVQRIDLASKTVNLEFEIGSIQGIGPLCAWTLQVMPGSPGTVAVGRSLCGTAQGTVAIYDNGVQRPNASPEIWFDPPVLAFSESPDLLYAFYPQDETVVRLRIDANGVTMQDWVAHLLRMSNAYALVYKSGVLYDGSGRALDTSTDTILGEFTFPSNLFLTRAFLVDSGSAYFLSYGSDLKTGYASSIITKFNVQTFQQTGSLTIVNHTPSDALVKCGNLGFAFTAELDSAVVLTSDSP